MKQFVFFLGRLHFLGLFVVSLLAFLPLLTHDFWGLYGKIEVHGRSLELRRQWCFWWNWKKSSGISICPAKILKIPIGISGEMCTIYMFLCFCLQILDLLRASFLVGSLTFFIWGAVPFFSLLFSYYPTDSLSFLCQSRETFFNSGLTFCFFIFLFALTKAKLGCFLGPFVSFHHTPPIINGPCLKAEKLAWITAKAHDC